uniref:WRKY domain-containing protein n=1 Tax=Ananas comosus var. bracteatus TaxID=296719 RepID=A0A6V7QES5_ANACO|nr:unnamed protein product [Ananas comosus var. bracteatus]
MGMRMRMRMTFDGDISRRSRSGGRREEQPPEVGGGRLVMPEDGYEWKKYGQKFIRNIQMIRSYFKCRNNRCNAKKRVEWIPSNPTNNIRIVYDGQHSHGAPSGSDQASSSANQYDLGNQVFGRSNNEPS